MALVRLRRKPTPTQNKIITSPAKYKVFMAGRRYGKTLSGALWQTSKVIGDDRPGVHWWVAPTYDICRRGIRAFQDIWPNRYYEFNKTEKCFYFANGAEVWFKTAENPDQSLLGEGIKSLVVDEAAIVDDLVWQMYLQPTLGDYDAECLFISTPRPHGWFKDLYYLGKNGDDPEVEVFQFPSWDNFLRFPGGEDDPKIKRWRKSMPEIIFRQEIGAEVIEDADTVFRNVDDCVEASLESNPCQHSRIKLGVDLAQHVDWTVITPMCQDCHAVLGTDRFQHREWASVRSSIWAAYHKHNATKLVIDATGIGDPVVEELQRTDMDVEAFKFTGTSKNELIQNLMLGFENLDIKLYQDDPNFKSFISELKTYRYKYSAAGKLSYNAPQGLHDDCVCSLALAYWGVTKLASGGIVFV